MTDQNENQVLSTAHAAFQKFQSGWANGDFTDYLAMIAEDFEFAFPMGDNRGVFTGRDGHDKMIAKCRADSKMRLTISEPRTVGIDRQTVIFEFESAGKFGATDFHGRNIIVLSVDGAKICGFRE